jgi:hypothetical protein
MKHWEWNLNCSGRMLEWPRTWKIWMKIHRSWVEPAQRKGHVDGQQQGQKGVNVQVC